MEKKESKWLNKNEYNQILEKYVEDVVQISCELMKKYTAICAIILGLLTITSLFLDFSYLLLAYILAFILSCTMLVVIKFLREKLSVKILYALMYTYIILCFAFSTYLGVISPDGTIATFIFQLTCVPICFIDKFGRIIACIIIGILMYCIASIIMLKGFPLINNIINSIVYGSIGLFIGRYITCIKLRFISTNNKLRVNSITDELTGLGNRRKMFELVNELENNKEICGYIMVNIDFFKKYNDLYGHQMGDKCLVKLGEIFKEIGNDYNEEMFRYGGEEFLMPVRNTDETIIVQRILSDVQKANIPFINSSYGRVTVSIGYYRVTEKTKYMMGLKAVDEALYQAKNSGRNKACEYIDRE